jgi:hypothetical protein
VSPAAIMSKRMNGVGASMQVGTTSAFDNMYTADLTDPPAIYNVLVQAPDIPNFATMFEGLPLVGLPPGGAAVLGPWELSSNASADAGVRACGCIATEMQFSRSVGLAVMADNEMFVAKGIPQILASHTNAAIATEAVAYMTTHGNILPKLLSEITIAATKDRGVDLHHLDDVDKKKELEIFTAMWLSVGAAVARDIGLKIKSSGGELLNIQNVQALCRAILRPAAVNELTVSNTTVTTDASVKNPLYRFKPQTHLLYDAWWSPTNHPATAGTPLARTGTIMNNIHSNNVIGLVAADISGVDLNAGGTLGEISDKEIDTAGRMGLRAVPWELDNPHNFAITNGTAWEVDLEKLGIMDKKCILRSSDMTSLTNAVAGLKQWCVEYSSMIFSTQRVGGSDGTKQNPYDYSKNATGFNLRGKRRGDRIFVQEWYPTARGPYALACAEAEANTTKESTLQDAVADLDAVNWRTDGDLDLYRVDYDSMTSTDPTTREIWLDHLGAGNKGAHGMMSPTLSVIGVTALFTGAGAYADEFACVFGTVNNFVDMVCEVSEITADRVRRDRDSAMPKDSYNVYPVATTLFYPKNPTDTPGKIRKDDLQSVDLQGRSHAYAVAGYARFQTTFVRKQLFFMLIQRLIQHRLFTESKALGKDRVLSGMTAVTPKLTEFRSNESWFDPADTRHAAIDDKY